ncbi:hypothetical protein ACFE04_028737 [Oxalis oulophora]
MAKEAGGGGGGGACSSASSWENSKDYCLLSEKPFKRNVVVNRWKRGAKLNSCTSAHDLRCLDIEKEKNDVSSPRGVIEACLNDLETNTDSSSENSTSAEIRHMNSRHSHWRKFKFLKAWKKKSVKCVPPLPLSLPKMPSRKCKSTRDNPVLRDFYYFKSSLKEFTMSELQANLIGKGGFAKVYKGTLPDGKLIAVKQLTKGTIDEKATVLLSEIGIMAHVNHRNVAKLVGSCIDGGMHLIFQLSQLGSLGSILHGSEVSKLDWSKRYKIALGIADGLMYLHETCEKRIIHRDIKADNILLTEDFEPQSISIQICDFGLAKWLPKQWTHHNVSKFEGTFGYFAPEYFMHGIVDEKTDIFAFGVLLLELVTGRPALDDVQQSLVIWSKPLLADNTIKELVDPSLGDDYDAKEMDRVIWSASSCIKHSPILRPQMSQVVVMLRGEEYAAELAKEFPKRSLHRTYSEELFDAQEYNSTKHLDRFREIALAS